MAVKAACVIVGILLLHQASALDVEKVREAIGVLLHETMKATSFIRIPRESRNESEQNGDHSITIPEYYARLFCQSASPQMTTLYNHFRSITNSECADGIMSMIWPVRRHSSVPIRRPSEIRCFGLCDGRLGTRKGF